MLWTICVFACTLEKSVYHTSFHALTNTIDKTGVWSTTARVDLLYSVLVFDYLFLLIEFTLKTSSKGLLIHNTKDLKWKMTNLSHLRPQVEDDQLITLKTSSRGRIIHNTKDLKWKMTNLSYLRPHIMRLFIYIPKDLKWKMTNLSHLWHQVEDSQSITHRT